MSEGSDLSSMRQNGGRGEGSLRSKYDGGSTMGLTMGGGNDDGMRDRRYGEAGSREGREGAGGDNDEIVSRSQRWGGAERSASPMAAATSDPVAGANVGMGDNEFRPSPPADAEGEESLLLISHLCIELKCCLTNP